MVKSRTSSRNAVARRRGRVLELRLAGYSLSQIVEKLQEDPQFKHATVITITNDYNWLNKYAREELIESETIIKNTFQKVRDSKEVVIRDSHKKLEEINTDIRRIKDETRRVDVQLSADPPPGQELRESLETRRETLRRSLGILRTDAREEKKLILSSEDSYSDLPKKLGFVPEKHAVDVTDTNEQKLLKALEDAKDNPEEQKRLLHTYRTVRKILD